MSKVLKKIEVSNPLQHFHLWEDLEKYEKIESDEELAAFYQELLSKYEGRPLVTSFIYAMIAFSTGFNINPETLIEL